jgi:hypothetical protein
LSATRGRIARSRRRLNPAWGLSGGSSESQPTYGVTIAPLSESAPDHIVVGDVVYFLPGDKTCHLTIGTRVKVLYAEQEDGRKVVEKVAAVLEH